MSSDKKILLITDAWHPQTNGVVTTLDSLTKQASLDGDEITIFHPLIAWKHFPLPGYREISVGIPSFTQIRDTLKKEWDAIHIATPEGTVGQAFAIGCRLMGKQFTVSCHTKFPEFVNSRYPWIPVSLGWWLMRRCYAGAPVILTTTDTMVKDLRRHGFKQEIVPWTRGVDRTIFNPERRTKDSEEGKPEIICVSRVSHEKNLDVFCQLPYANKTLVGDGPYLETLKRKYPDVRYTGMLKGEALAMEYANGDVFVFPSLVDTFGVVMIEAMATGTPVAAYPVTGPIDVVTPETGHLDEDLEYAISKCLELDRGQVYEESLHWTWEECYRQFKSILQEASCGYTK